MMWTVFALLTLLAAAFVIYPLVKKSSRPVVDKAEATFDLVEHKNVELFKEQLLDLKQQLENGDIKESQYSELVSEQKRLLLNDAPDKDLRGSLSHAIATQSTGRGAWLLIACLLSVPLVAFGLYQVLGASDDVEIAELLETRMTASLGAEDYSVLSKTIQSRISRKLASETDNVFYLVTLARLQMEDANFSAATASYQKAVSLAPNDAELMAEYAQALYFAAGSKFEGEAGLVLDNALGLDPGNRTALGLNGIRAFELGDYQLAVRSWQLALQSIPPGSPQAQALQSGILRARKQLGEELPSLTVKVALSPDLEVTPGQVVYVFAREWQGKPMPLAVARLLVEDLPTTVILDDTMAMPGGAPLSSIDSVEVVARVSLSGSAIPSAGDLEGVTGELEMGNRKVPVQVVIDHQL